MRTYYVYRAFGKAMKGDPEQRMDLLAEARERLELAIEGAELGTFYCPLPLDRIEWNAKAKEHFFLPPDAEVNFDLFYSRIDAQDRDRVREAIKGGFQRGDPYDVEYRVVAPDGRSRWVRAKGRFYRDAAGNPVRFDGITIDVTDRKNLEDERKRNLDLERSARTEAERTSRMKDEFLATLSHELRTPLNAILGWTQLLRRTNRRPEDHAEGLSVIERNARNQAQLIEDLLDMSRIISGRLRLDVQSVNLAEIIHAAADVIRPAADAKRIRLQFTLDPNANSVSGDPARLQQIFWNLLSNAVKFTPSGGHVHVILERVNSHVQISVCDTGQGIKSDFLPYVFERFRQQDGSIRREHRGLGLGLAIVKHLVEYHGGQVRAQSAGEGRGSTFTVLLPLAPLRAQSDGNDPHEHPTTAVESERIDDPPRLVGIEVLVVEDDRDSRELLRHVLEERGAKVVTVADASDAMTRLAERRPDLLLSDIEMPNVDGYEFIRRVRQLAPEQGGNVPAVAITAFARSQDRRRALLAGYQMHIAKPFEPEELVAVCASVAGLVNRPRTKADE